MKTADLLEECQDEAWDLIVIGGGITGAGVLREAARAGLKAILLEQRDFAWGTSSRSGKWVHGGLRYMQQGQAHVTWESVRERERLVREVPGLIDMKPMYMAFGKGQGKHRAIMRLAVWIYDLMAGKRRNRMVSGDEVRKRFPGYTADGLRDALVFYEAQTDDARLTLRVLNEAQAAGGVALNYVKAAELLVEDGGVVGVLAEDAESGRRVPLRARQVIAATGAWADKMRAEVPGIKKEHLRPLRGSHLVFSADRLPFTETIVLDHPVDGRNCFIMPWQGRMVIGNTDLDHKEDMDIEAAVSSAEVDYLLAPLTEYFPDSRISRDDILATFSGVRPVVDSGKANPSKESRDHVVWIDHGLLTIAGGKLTTFRHIARDALTAAEPRLGKLSGFSKGDRVFTPYDLPEQSRRGLDAETALRLSGRYGAAAADLVAGASADDLTLIAGTETLWAELRWCAEWEQVHHLEDLLLRRTRIGLLLPGGGVAQFDRIRRLVQAPLGWSDDRWRIEEAAYRQVWHAAYSVPGQPRESQPPAEAA